MLRPSITLVALLAIIAPQVATAQYSVYFYELFMNEGSEQQKEGLDAHIAGIGAGISAVNAELQVSGGTPLFCMPANLTMNADSLHTMINNALEDYRVYVPPKRLEEMPLSLIILEAYKQAFPCE